MTHFLIIGSAGMAGHMIYTYLKEQGQGVYGIDLRKNGFSVDEIVDTGNWVALQAACKRPCRLRIERAIHRKGAVLLWPKD